MTTSTHSSSLERSTRTTTPVIHRGFDCASKCTGRQYRNDFVDNCCCNHRIHLWRARHTTGGRLCRNHADGGCGVADFSGNTGIVSFGHAGFMGIGAYLTGILTMPAAMQATTLRDLPSFLAGYQLPFLGALLVVVVAAVVVGLITGIPLLRLSGSSAPIATLALLIIIYTVLVAAREITRGSQPFYGVPRDVGLWTTVLVAAAALTVARIFRDTPSGLPHAPHLMTNAVLLPLVLIIVPHGCFHGYSASSWRWQRAPCWHSSWGILTARLLFRSRFHHPCNVDCRWDALRTRSLFRCCCHHHCYRGRKAV